MQHCVGEDLDISRYDSTSSSSGKDEMEVVLVGGGYVLRQSGATINSEGWRVIVLGRLKMSWYPSYGTHTRANGLQYN
jgi:hypothetical protein